MLGGPDRVPFFLEATIFTEKAGANLLHFILRGVVGIIIRIAHFVGEGTLSTKCGFDYFDAVPHVNPAVFKNCRVCYFEL